MGKLNQPGYPLPAGELGEDEIVCQLVFLPNRPEYWQALVSSIHYLATWRAWERDIDKRGKDAASDWRVANELTMECWRMACLQDLQDDVAAILAILELPQSCCDEGDITDGDQYTDRVTDGEGDVPQNIIDAGYADDAADWDGFDDYKCMISHVIVDQLYFKLLEFEPLLTGTGAVLGGVAALAGILAVIVSTAGLAIVFGIVAGIGATALLYQALTDFDLVSGLAAKVLTNKDELVCAIMYADGDAGALAALNDKIDELFTVLEALVLKNMNLGPTLKALYAGRYDQQDIADILLDAGYDLGDFVCDCQQIGEFAYYTDFETGDLEEWDDHDADVVAGEGVGSSYACRLRYGDSEDIYHSVASILQAVGESPGAGDKLVINRIRFSYRMGGSSGQCRLILVHDGGTVEEYYAHSPTFVEIEEVFSPPLESTYTFPYVVRILEYGYTFNYLYIDNITVDMDYIPAP